MDSFSPSKIFKFVAFLLISLHLASSCSTGEFEYWNSSCLSSCNFPLVKSTNGHGDPSCLFPCTKLEFLYYDGSCQASCDSPLITTIEGDKQFCDIPCSGANQYLYPENTCLSTCTFPMQTVQVRNKLYCRFPCEEEEALYFNGTCSDLCYLPHRYRQAYGRDFCDYPCTGSQVLYFNGTCLPACVFPFANNTINGKNYCDFPCNEDEYLLYNRTCSTVCDRPLIPRREYLWNFCDWPCQSATPYLALWNTKCIGKCDFPLVTMQTGLNYFCNFTCDQKDEWDFHTTQYFNGSCMDACYLPHLYRNEYDRDFCDYPCNGNQVLYYDGSCHSTCGFPFMNNTINGKKYCDFPCNEDEYLFYNRTCSVTCDWPLVPRKEYLWNFCDWPCTNSSTYLALWNTKCIDKCDLPLVKIQTGLNHFCNYTCKENEVLYFNGTCRDLCSLPHKLRQDHDRDFCDSPCVGNEILNADGSCLDNSADCKFPLIYTIRNGKKYCDSPCLEGKNLYYNGSCEASCDRPLVSKRILGSNICDSPCETSEQYLFQDGTCSSSCASPLVKSTNSGRNFCTYPCDSSAEYLNPDSSCSTACNSPYVITQYKNMNFCLSTCQTGKYRYFNNSCLSTCNFPLMIGTQNGELSCEYPCTASESLYDDGSCQTSCPSPYQERMEADEKYCERKTTTTSSSDSSSTSDDDAGFFKNSFLIAPIEAGATSLVCFVKNMHYIRYLDIEMSPRLERLVQSQPRNILTLQYGVTMPARMIERFGDSPLIPAFQKPGTHSSFFVNYFQTFTSIAIVLFAGFCFQIFEKVSMKQGYKTWQAIFEVLRVIFKWNFCLILFAFNIDFVILFSFLEFETVERSLGSGLSNFSLVTNIFMILTSVIFFIGLIYLIRKVSQMRARIAPEPITNTVSAQENYLIVPGRWQSFRVLFAGFNETHPVARYFYLIYTLRIGLPIFFACCLYHFPMISASLQVLISISTLAFILLVKPLKKKINLVQLFIFETLALMTNICILILTALDTSQSSRVLLGDVVIIGNSLTNLLSLVFLAIKLYLEIKALMPLLPKMPKHEKYASFVKLFLILVQQGAMGFESIFDELTPTNPTRNPPVNQIATINTETGLKGSLRTKKRNLVFPTLSTEGDKIFDNYATFTKRLKETTPGANRTFNDNTSQIGLKENISQLGRREDTSCLGTQGDTSPTFLRGDNNLSFAVGAGENLKGNSQIFTPQKDFEPFLVQNKRIPGKKNKLRLKTQTEPYFNYNDISGMNNGGQNQGVNTSFIHPYSASSALSLDISNNSPQIRQPDFRTGTNLLTSGNLKIHEEERGVSEVDDQLDEKTGR